MTGYAEMTSQGGFHENTTQAYDDHQNTASVRAAILQRREAMAWVAEHIPEAVGDWDSFAAYALICLDRKKRDRSVVAVKREMVRQDPWIADYINEKKGAASA